MSEPIPAGSVPEGEPPGTDGADALLQYLQNEAHLRRQADFIEVELMSRLEIVKEHHRLYAKTANHFVKLLQKAAEDSNFIFGSINHHVEAAQQQQQQQQGSAFRDDDSFSAPSSAPPSRNASFMDPMSPSSPNRLVVVPPSASATKVASTLKLSAAPQIHHKLVTERRMGQEIDQERRRLKEYAQKEFRRTEAYARKQQQSMDRQHDKDDKVKHVKDWAKVKVDRERSARYQRETVREKHDTLQRNRELSQLERQAATSAIRKLDDMTRKVLAQSKATMHKEKSVVAAGALYVQQSNDEDRAHADKAVYEARSSKHIAKTRFKNEFNASMAAVSRGIHRDEHHSSIDYMNKIAGSPAVQVEWPADVLQVKPTSPAKPIDDHDYMRLCGVGHFMSNQRPGSLGRGDREQESAQIHSLKHLAPAHWKMIKSVTPDPKWESLQRMQASMVQGPKHIRWQ